MSCQGAPLQTIPRDPRYRACFRPDEGRVLVKADYSQIELRIAAEIADDKRMLEAYAAGEDVHTITAAAVLGRANGQVMPEDRQAAKALNFGLLYGMGAERLREHARDNYGVNLTDDEAYRFRERFFSTYPGLRRWHQRHQSDGLLDTRTLAGRRRLKVSRFPEQLNSPVQGTGADGLKAALALLWETRDRCPDAAPVLVVHDEIVVECDAGRAEQARDWLKDCMTRGMGEFLTKVPVVVEAKVCRDWSGKEAEV
jgi:DNA polymerase-1